MGDTPGAGDGEAHFRQRIEAGLARLATFQHADGRFSIWCGGQPGIDITARVAHRLLGFEDLPFEPAFALRARAAAALKDAGYRDNQLLPLGADFRAPLETVADAVALYFHAPDTRAESLRYLRHSAERQADGSVSWPAAHRYYWGGVLESTCDAARVMLHAGDPLFLPAFRHVTGRLVDGMLYSTADTRALVELLAGLGFDAADEALVDGRRVPLREVSIGRQVTALTDHLIVRLDEQVVIDHLRPRDDFAFSLWADRQDLRLGERLTVKIRPQETSIAPLVRLYLPGCLALLKGGANAQTAHLPVEGDELLVEAVAVRPGRGKLRVVVHDMYDADKVGVAPAIEIRVAE